MIGETFSAVLESARRGDQFGWDVLYRDLAGPLAGYFRSRGITDADDLVGETFLHVARNLSGFAGDEGQFRAWVFTIAHRRRVDAVRRNARSGTVAFAPEILAPLVDALNRADDELDVVVERLDRAGALGGLLAALTDDQAEVLILRFGADLDATTVGVMTNRSTNAVAALTARALARLRDILTTTDVASVT